MNVSKNWDLRIDPGVLRTLKRIPRQDGKVILEVIRFLPVNPYFGDIQKMKGEDNAWRRRTGSYRIFYNINVAKRIIFVFHLERRNSKTY